MKLLEYCYYFLGFLVVNFIFALTDGRGFDLTGAIVRTVVLCGAFVFLTVFWNMFVKKKLQKSIKDDDHA
ncbi:MAG: hypothetical protein FWE06_09395 [Oscillospiraceae bacterium]|nr:hypothetical protein [Oscillospiraceae bacterium]